jgi:hypothetical protein
MLLSTGKRNTKTKTHLKTADLYTTSTYNQPTLFWVLSSQRATSYRRSMIDSEQQSTNRICSGESCGETEESRRKEIKIRIKANQRSRAPVLAWEAWRGGRGVRNEGKGREKGSEEGGH